ncbi:MAG: TolC family protein [Gammaproteobacteria bacterium]|nr:TolC family protein [Gammaproteobacteria bacterium]
MFRLIFLCFILFSSNIANAEVENSQLTLSLQEAILLAVRENPNVEIAQLNEVEQKFSLHVQQWQFVPHLALVASVGVNKDTVNGVQQTTRNPLIQPTATWLSPIGTQATLSLVNPFANHANPSLSLQIVQPLMRGFGRPIVEAALDNARDSEEMSRLNIEGTLRNTVTAVIIAYLNAVSAENTVKLDQAALERAQTSVTQTKLFIKGGHKAGNELVTVQADVASAETTLENDKNNSQQARFALLAAIGLDPNTNVRITNLDVSALIHKYHQLSLAETQEHVLMNDIQYRVDQITLEGSTKRNLMQAEDNTRPQLNLSLNAGTNSGLSNGQNGGIASLFNGANESKGATLSIAIPLDDQVAKQGVLNAKIALREAMLALKQEKWNKETSAINSWNTVGSAERALKFAENAADLQQKNYQLTNKKYLYGLINSIELQSVRQQLNQNQQALISAQLNYLSSLVNIDLLVGTTLETWNIKVRLA